MIFQNPLLMVVLLVRDAWFGLIMYITRPLWLLFWWVNSLLLNCFIKIYFYDHPRLCRGLEPPDLVEEEASQVSSLVSTHGAQIGPGRYQYAVGSCPREPSTPCFVRYQAFRDDKDHFQFAWEFYKF